MIQLIEKSQFDFNTGIPLSPGELKKYRDEAANSLINERDTLRAYDIRTGNMITVAFRDSRGRISVVQSEGYIEYTYQPKD